MIWFITALTINNKKTKGESLVGTSRVFGFFEEHVKALRAVVNDTGNMHECLYSHIVLEGIYEGIHPEVVAEEWFEWDQLNGCWRSCDKPKELEHIVNFSIG